MKNPIAIQSSSYHQLVDSSPRTMLASVVKLTPTLLNALTAIDLGGSQYYINTTVTLPTQLVDDNPTQDLCHNASVPQT